MSSMVLRRGGGGALVAAVCTVCSCSAHCKIEELGERAQGVDVCCEPCNIFICISSLPVFPTHVWKANIVIIATFVFFSLLFIACVN